MRTVSPAKAKHCPLCAGAEFLLAIEYQAPPRGETAFRLPVGDNYSRLVYQCTGCGHFISESGFSLDALYSGEYVASTYGKMGLRASYEKIMQLDASRSDNIQRVKRVTEFCKVHQSPTPGSLLDIGSGLCVFPARMKEQGWQCTALDPDLDACQHARDYVMVEAIQGDFFQIHSEKKYDLVTFNKVLEHVSDPVAMLRRATTFLNSQGLVYIEVPDGETAIKSGPEREEFFIEHLHVFSFASTSLLAKSAGFQILEQGRIVEPSTKFTIFAFLRPEK